MGPRASDTENRKNRPWTIQPDLNQFNIREDRNVNQVKLRGKPLSALLPLRNPLHFVYLKNLHNLKDVCHNDEETGSKSIFHSSQISFKEHQADMVKEKKKKRT